MENEKISAAFAKTHPFHRYSGEQRAEHAAAIAILVEQASISANQSRRGKRQFFRARFYHGAKIRLSLLLPRWESCWGVPSPNPAYAAYAA